MTNTTKLMATIATLMYKIASIMENSLLIPILPIFTFYSISIKTFLQRRIEPIYSFFNKYFVPVPGKYQKFFLYTKTAIQQDLNEPIIRSIFRLVNRKTLSDSFPIFYLLIRFYVLFPNSVHRLLDIFEHPRRP